MRAARVGDTDELRQLLEAGMDPGRYVLVDQGMVSPMAEQVTALHLAAFGGHLVACRLLLANGSEVDALTLPLERRESGDTPLMRAVWGRSLAVAELLLEAGADVDDVDGLTGDTPRQLAACISADRRARAASSDQPSPQGGAEKHATKSGQIPSRSSADSGRMLNSARAVDTIGCAGLNKSAMIEAQDAWMIAFDPVRVVRRDQNGHAHLMK